MTFVQSALATARAGVFAGAFAVALGAAALADHHEEAEAAMAPPVGPAIGANIAETLAAQDQTGADRTFADLTGSSGAVVTFSRSLDWCPFCKAQALQIEEALPEFFDRGYAVVILTTDDVEKLATYAGRNQTQMTLLADPDSEIITELGLLDPSFEEGSRSYGLPYPTTLVLNNVGDVAASLMMEELVGQNGSYRQRIEVQDVLDAIDSMNAEPEA